MINTPLTKRLHMKRPILLAGMANISLAPLAAAVSNAGGMGVMGGALLTPETLQTQITELKSLLKSPHLPWGIDLLLPKVGVDQSFTKAREWWTKAASQGLEHAINALQILDEAEGRTSTTSSTVNSNTTFCSYCNTPEPPNRCQQCRSVSYCNRECQIKHWKKEPDGHKKQCQKLAAAFKTLNKKQ